MFILLYFLYFLYSLIIFQYQFNHHCSNWPFSYSCSISHSCTLTVLYYLLLISTHFIILIFFILFNYYYYKYFLTFISIIVILLHYSSFFIVSLFFTPNLIDIESCIFYNESNNQPLNYHLITF